MPTVEEIVAEARQAREEKMADLVKVRDLAIALGIPAGTVTRKCRRLGIEYTYTRENGAAYVSRKDAVAVAEALL